MKQKRPRLGDHPERGRCYAMQLWPVSYFTLFLSRSNSAFLRLVDDEQVEALSQTALGGTGAELDAALTAFQPDALPARGTNGFVFYLGLVQQAAQALPRGMTGGRAVGCVQDVLAPLETVQLPHGGDLILAVAAGDAVAEFGMYPQAVLVFGEDVVEQELLPLLDGTPGGVVEVDGLLPVGRGVSSTAIREKVRTGSSSM